MHLKPYSLYGIILRMTWTVLFHSDFEAEFGQLPEDVQNELLARLGY